MLAQTESLFALSNGYIGVRGNLDEGEPHGIPGTYLNGFYELRPLPSAESQYGTPESSQTLIDVTNGKLLRLLVDDEPFDVRYGAARSRTIACSIFAPATLQRTAEWRSPARRTVRVTSTRLVSFTHRAILAIALRGRAARRPRQRRRAVGAGGQRGDPARRRAIRAAPAERRVAARLRGARRRAARRRC